ncbi:MAG: ABC transporter ATP-binding protein [Rhodospirillaceae bacterium]|jgi:lipoprotein-releasing system ATP-binding protein|nr:ABC transporter ATP-binding protein [Rhodospirillaceae bacterium]MBT4589287.1 ABC transporter ATP-binding protein [Rhodospirillaceae bacterium]MBT5941576.1 ABC transporter ATP-binding protein [Rhodospirillaceae bacterium]MBT7267190.1 ABC transporter ATP-binding protein [Rhodospirillaceae bacterium]
MSNTALELQFVVQTFHQAETPLEVLRGVNLTVEAGEIVALVGPSGSGKSTLLQIAGLLEHPQSGEVIVKGEGVKDLSDDRRTEIRRQELGFVYQYHHLLAEFSARENIIIPQMIAQTDKKPARARADELLEIMGLTDRATHRPARLSGGEQQRVAIARALANKPNILLADEPTGNLDPTTADGVFNLLTDLVKRTGVGALIATHNPNLANRMDRIVSLEDGVLVTS